MLDLMCEFKKGVIGQNAPRHHPPPPSLSQNAPPPLQKRFSLQIAPITEDTFSTFLHSIILFFYDSRNPKKRFLNQIVPLIHAIIPKFVSTIIV